MSFKIKMIDCGQSFRNSTAAFVHPLGHMAGHSFWDAYAVAHDVEIELGYIIFKSEAAYTWFIMRWT